MKCRTCLRILGAHCKFPLETDVYLGKTVEEIIQFFIPEMIKSDFVGDFICSSCMDAVMTFINFIENCNSVESYLKEKVKRKQVPEIKNEKCDDYNVIETMQGKSQEKSSNYDILNQKFNKQSDSLLEVDSSQSEQKPLEGSGLSTHGTTSFLYINLDPKIEVLNDDNDNGATKVNKIPSKKRRPESYGQKLQKLLEKERISAGYNSIKEDVTPPISEQKLKENMRRSSKIRSPSKTLVRPAQNSISSTKLTNSTPATPSTPISKNDDIVKTINLERYRFPVFSSINRCLSIPVPNETTAEEFLKTFAKQNINLKKLHSLQATGSKRVLFLGNALLCCPECKKYFSTDRVFKTHIKETHPTSTIVAESLKPRPHNDCPICKKRFAQLPMLESHVSREHAEAFLYMCDKCGMQFKRKFSYSQHRKNYEMYQDCETKRCNVCKKMINRQVYAEHYKTHKIFECEICTLGFTSQYHLRFHRMKIHHQDTEDKPKPKGEVLCPVCGKLMGNLSLLRSHLVSHSETRPHLCDKCSKRFKTNGALVSHIKKVHESRYYECSICMGKMKSRDALRYHIRLKHVNVYNHMCEVCGKGFSRKDYYLRHMNQHSPMNRNRIRIRKRKYLYNKMDSNEPTLPCKYCSKKFAYIENLRLHLLSVHMKNPVRLKCRYCDLTFSNGGNRIRHEKRHQDPDTFELTCNVCHKRFDNKKELTAHHLIKHEGSQRHPCEMCDETFPSKYFLRHHKAEKHFDEDRVNEEKNDLLRDALSDLIADI